MGKVGTFLAHFGFDKRGDVCNLLILLKAGVVELGDARDSKSRPAWQGEGSIPSSGTIKSRTKFFYQDWLNHLFRAFLIQNA